MYFTRLKDLSKNPQLAARHKFMLRDVIDLRSNDWVPRREEVIAMAYYVSCNYTVAMPHLSDLVVEIHLCVMHMD